MVCADMSEADQISRQLEQLDGGYLVTYRRAEDLVHNSPAGRVALVILATNDSAVVLGRTLKWLRRRWPRCPITVVGDRGGGETELAARKEAACYLTRPVDPEQWRALLVHALGQIVPRQLDDGRRP
jgi:DNA-binding NtrC family response regulator